MDILLCIDVGGTELKISSFDTKGNSLISKPHRYSSYSNSTKEEIFKHFSNIINSFYFDNFNIIGIGMAFPGPFDFKNGISLMRGLSKYDSIYGCSIEKEIKKLNDNWINPCKFIFLHDIAAFSLGCCHMEPPYQFEKVMYLCIGTGTGTAFTLNGEIDISSLVLPENGWIYNTNFKDSIIDNFISARGLRSLSMKYFGIDINGYELQKLAENGNKLALDLFSEFGQLLAESITPFLIKYNAQRLVLGGQISKGFTFFAKDIKKICKKNYINIDCKYNTSEMICLGLLEKFKLEENQYGIK